jgi:hypothetical protein
MLPYQKQKRALQASQDISANKRLVIFMNSSLVMEVRESSAGSSA